MTGDDGIYGVYLAVRASLARTLLRIVPPKEVEDIVQETYVRVCQIERTGRHIQQPRAFLFKTARNLALDYLKRSETRLTSSLDDLVEQQHDFFELSGAGAEHFADQTFEAAASKQEFALFCEAVRELPLQCRRVFVLRKVYGYSQQEIAHQLNLSENTVEKHIAQGIKRCTYFMQKYDIHYAKKRPPAKTSTRGNKR